MKPLRKIFAILGIVVALCVMLVTITVKNNFDRNTQEPKVKLDDVRIALAKYKDVPMGTITNLRVTQQVGKYIAGYASGAGEGGGFVFFALWEKGKWTVITDDNGLPLCSDVDPFKIPKELLRNCVNENGQEQERAVLE